MDRMHSDGNVTWKAINNQPNIINESKVDGGLIALSGNSNLLYNGNISIFLIDWHNNAVHVLIGSKWSISISPSTVVIIYITNRGD